MDRDTMGGVFGTVLGATMVGAGIWMLMRDRDDMGEMNSMDDMSRTGDEKSSRRLRAMSDSAGRAMESTRAASGRMNGWVADSPLVAGLAALALGALAGAVIPETQRENEILGEYRDRAAEKAREAARQVVDRGRDMAVNAVHTATESIKQQATGETREDRSDRGVGIRQDAEI